VITFIFGTQRYFLLNIYLGGFFKYLNKVMQEKKSYIEVSCPYNPEHKMDESRLIWHIGKGCKDKVVYSHELITRKKKNIFSLFVHTMLFI
jgi:U11-48K-like CHHC zinc finger